MIQKYMLTVWGRGVDWYLKQSVNPSLSFTAIHLHMIYSTFYWTSVVTNWHLWNAFHFTQHTLTIEALWHICGMKVVCLPIRLSLTILSQGEVCILVVTGLLKQRIILDHRNIKHQAFGLVVIPLRTDNESSLFIHLYVCLLALWQYDIWHEWQLWGK